MPDQASWSAIAKPMGDPHEESAYLEDKRDQRPQPQLAIDHSGALRIDAGRRIRMATGAVAACRALSAAAGEDEDLARYHALAHMLDEWPFHPPHDKRDESADYHAIHVQMTIADDLPCIVCGVRNSMLGEVEKNPFGAILMETHHHVIQRALAAAIQADKFNAHVRPDLFRAARRRAQDPAYAATSPLYKKFDEAYAAPMDIATIRRWIDHAADNLRVLCDVHHRHRHVGIHAVTCSIWGPQDLVDADCATIVPASTA